LTGSPDSAGAPRVAIIGAGAMGGAMAAGLAAAGVAAIGLVDVRPDAATSLAAEVGGQVVSAAEAARAEVLFLAVKPADAAATIAQIPAAAREAVLVSVVAGLGVDRLRDLAGGRVVRAMPSLAARHGAGLLAVASDPAEADAHAVARPLLDLLGEVVELPERLFPAATALVGSGPGHLALVAEALEDGAVSCGVVRPDARRMVAATFAGTAALLGEGLDPAVLRQRVSSPAGTTMAGLAVLERGGVRGHIGDAVRASAARAEEL